MTIAFQTINNKNLRRRRYERLTTISKYVAICGRRLGLFRLRYMFALTGALICGNTLADSNDHIMYVNQVCDSLKQILTTQSLTEKEELDVYNNLINHYASFYIDSVIIYAPQAISRAVQLKDLKSEMENYCHLGVALCYKSKYDSAHACIERMREIAISINDIHTEITADFFVAFIYNYQGRYTTAIDYYLKVLRKRDAANYKGSSTGILANISELYRRMHNREMAVKYLDMAFRSVEDYPKSPAWEWQIGQIYNEYAILYLEAGEFDKAREYALKTDSLTQSGIVNDCSCNILLAQICLKQNDYARALHYAQKAITKADVLQDKALYVESWMTLSDVYLAEKRYREAETEALKAWQADSANTDAARTIALNIALANLHLGNTDKAAFFINKYTELNKLFAEKSFQNTVADLAFNYETEKKELRIAELEYRNLLYVLTGVFFILLTVFVWILLIQKHKRERIKIFFEGEMDERERIARDLHDGINNKLTVIRNDHAIMNDTSRLQAQLDECIEDIRRLSNDMMPVSLSLYGLKEAIEDRCLQNGATFIFNGKQRRLKDYIERTIYFCASELINNAVKHAKATKINVHLTISNKHVSLAVEDDGIGFDKNKIVSGNGLRNIRKRANNLKGNLDVVASPGYGASITVAFNC